MLKKRSVQEIIDLKKLGFTPAEIAEQLRQKGAKVPSMPTIRKYFNMSDPPEDMSQHLAKEKAFDQEPFRSAVLKILENNQENPNLHISSVYDCLMEIFVENGDYRNLPGNEQTLRNYIHYLKKADLVQLAGSQPRLYDRVFDTEPGDQMLLDFGEQKIENGYTIYFLCMLLRYSRLLLVMPQDHKFNSEEACRAIFRGFVRLGGRVKTLVIDQDSVFIADESMGKSWKPSCLALSVRSRN